MASAAEQVAQVRGFADRQLRHPEDPEHASNRRISVIVQYLTPPPGAAPAEEKGESKTAKGSKEAEHPKARSPKKPRKPKPEAVNPVKHTTGVTDLYMYSGIWIPSTPAVRSSWRRKKSVIHSRKTFFSRFSSIRIGYFW